MLGESPEGGTLASNRFFLLDQSLKDFGGHFFDYARNVLEAARDDGFQPILIGSKHLSVECPPWMRAVPYFHRDFWGAISTPPKTDPFALTEDEVAFLRGLTAQFGMPSNHANEITHRLPAPLPRPQTREDDSSAPRFIEQVVHYFIDNELHPGDQVFIPNISDEDTHALSKALPSIPRREFATWHLLYRRDLLRRCGDQYENLNSDHLALRSSLNDIVHNGGTIVRLYTDTDRLTEQCDLIFGEKIFRTLPIPVDERFKSVPGLSSKAAARVLYAGDARREKGYHFIPAMVMQAEKQGILGEKVIFDLQSNISSPRTDVDCATALDELRPYDGRGVELHITAFDSDQYRRRILDADIILITYDAQNYYARSSGIFAEAMTAGRPVLVSDDTWMAKHLPEGVGLTYRSPDELPGLLVDMVLRYPSFRSKAEKFAADWSREHSPKHLLELMLKS